MHQSESNCLKLKGTLKTCRVEWEFSISSDKIWSDLPVIMRMTADLWRLSGHKNLKASDQAIAHPVYAHTPVCSWQLKLTLCSSGMPVNTLMGPWGTSDINVMGHHHTSFFLLCPFIFLHYCLLFSVFLSVSVPLHNCLPILFPSQLFFISHSWHSEYPA